jgi:glycerophosphoryl diester phosphodiesterase
MSIRSWVIRIWVVGLFFVGTFSWNIAAHAQSNYFNYNAIAIMDAISNRHSDLVMVAAHRGLHAILDNNNNACCVYTVPATRYTVDYSNTPENSLQSIFNAAMVGIEVIELDVRVTQDGVPILSHDSTWGRETNVGSNYNSCCFNPWGPLPGLTAPDGDPGSLGGGADASSDPQAYRNPNVTDWSLYSVQQSNGGIILRNSANFSWSPWNQHPPTLQDALDYIKANKFSVVLSLDVKNGSDAAKAWEVVATNYDYKGFNYYNTAFFKMDAAWNFPYPANFINAFSNSYHVCTVGNFCNQAQQHRIWRIFIG